MNKTIGVLAHVDAGKTTFAEQLLFHAKSIKKRGRVDHQDTFLDIHDIEKKRGITVFSDQALMTYRDSNYYLIDTPGHTDFSPEMERSIQVMDYAILIVSAVEGVEGHTETVWQLLKTYQVPTFFFINKTDRIGADVNRAIEDIRLNLTQDVCDITDSMSDDTMSSELKEYLAERHDYLLEKYLEGQLEHSVWLSEMKQLIYERKLFPCMSGSALRDEGITDFLAKLTILTSTFYDVSESFAARVYKVRHDENGNRVTYIKPLSGTLNVRDECCYQVGDDTICEKVTQIRLYNGKRYDTVAKGEAGQLIAVIGLSKAVAGDGIGEMKEKIHQELVPTLKSTVIYDRALHIKDVIENLQILDAEDPSLNVSWDETFQEIHIHVMGIIQLEILQQIMLDRFNYNISFASPEILYKETIVSTVIGYGHFEPLKHYAEVHLKIEPNERNKGIMFINECHPDDLAVSYQHVIRQHLFEKEHHGLLTGSPLNDIKITLLTGRAHNKHTSGGDFREATYRALRQGLEKATTILLEPYYHFKIKIDLQDMGRVLSDIQIAHGRFNPPEIIGEKALITGVVPVVNFMNYSTVLASYTQGRGSIKTTFSGYERCHNENDIINKINYKKEADPEYTSSSVFCSKGQSYTVPWNEVENHIHC